MTNVFSFLDYRLLEEVTRGVDSFSRDELKTETFKSCERILPNVSQTKKGETFSFSLP